MDFKTKEKAFKFGEKMLKEINHPGYWKIDVWENMGIHVSLKNKYANIMIIPHEENDDIVYCVYASIDHMGCDDQEFTSEPSKDINEALILKLKEVKNSRDKIDHLYQELLKFKELNNGRK